MIFGKSDKAKKAQRQKLIETRRNLTDEQKDTLKSMDARASEYDKALNMRIDADHSLREAKMAGGRSYMGDVDTSPPRPGLMRARLPKTQASVQTTSANQLSQPLRVMVTARERGEPSRLYLTEIGHKKLLRAQEAGLFDPDTDFDAFGPLKPLDQDSEEGQNLLQLTKPRSNDLGQRIEPVLSRSDIIRVNDAKRAEKFKAMLDLDWERNHVNFTLMENQNNCTIFGDQLLTFRWDDVHQTFQLANPHWECYRLDPLGTMAHDSDGPIVYEYYRIDEAKKMFPDFAEEIEACRGLTTTPSQSTGIFKQTSAGGRVAVPHSPNAYAHVSSEEGLFVVATTWYRDVPYQYKTAEEAVKSGDVEVQVIPMTVGVGEEDGAEIFEPVFDENEELVFDVRYILTANKSPTFPNASNWPVKRIEKYDPNDETHILGVRQVQASLDHALLLYDGICPYKDIPAVWSKSSMIPYSPYGIGDTFRLRDIDRLINRLLSVFGNMVYYYQFPQAVMPKDLRDELGSLADEFYAHPGATMWLEGPEFEKWVVDGKARSFAVPPPEMPTFYFTLLNFLIDQHANLSMDQDVLRGEAPSPNASGKMVQALADNAKGVIMFKARGLEYVAEHIASLAIQCYIDFLPDKAWDRVLSDYPAIVREDILRSLRDIDYDIRVESIYGRGAGRDIRYQKAVELFGMGLYPDERTLEDMDVADPEEVVRELSEQRRRQAEEQNVSNQASQEAIEIGV